MVEKLKNNPLIFGCLALMVAAILLVSYAGLAHSTAALKVAGVLGMLTFGAYSFGPNGNIMSSAEAAGKNTNSIMQGWVDRGPWQYWDTITGNANTALSATYSPFSVPIGAQNPLPGPTIKTKLQTNMVRGNQFPPPRCLLLVQIGFYFASSMFKDDIDAFLNNFYMEFRIDDKIFHEGLAWLFPSGAGLSGVTTQTGESSYVNGLPAPVYSRRYDAWSKYIAPLQQFSMSIICPGTPPTMDANGPGLQLLVFLDGLTDRSVQ